MSKVMEFIDSFGKIEYKINKKGVLKLEIEAVARGLGFIEVKFDRVATSGGTRKVSQQVVTTIQQFAGEQSTNISKSLVTTKKFISAVSSRKICFIVLQ